MLQNKLTNLILQLDRIGRKNTIAGMFLLCGVSIWLLMNVTAARSFILSLCRASALGFNQSLWLYAVEVYPTSLRATGLGFSTAFARLGSVVSPFVAVVLFHRSPQLALSLCVLLSFLVSSLLVSLVDCKSSRTCVCEPMAVKLGGSFFSSLAFQAAFLVKLLPTEPAATKLQDAPQ